jgi:hypothetical protein
LRQMKNICKWCNDFVKLFLSNTNSRWATLRALASIKYCSNRFASLNSEGVSTTYSCWAIPILPGQLCERLPRLVHPSHKVPLKRTSPIKPTCELSANLDIIALVAEKWIESRNFIRMTVANFIRMVD